MDRAQAGMQFRVILRFMKEKLLCRSIQGGQIDQKVGEGGLCGFAAFGQKGDRSDEPGHMATLQPLRLGYAEVEDAQARLETVSHCSFVMVELLYGMDVVYPFQEEDQQRLGGSKKKELPGV